MNNYGLNWLGTFSQGGGYSGASEGMAVALERAGVDVRVMRLSPYHLRNVRPKGRELLQKQFQFFPVGVAFSYPTAFSSLFNHKVRIGYTMFEFDKLPDVTEHNSDWVQDCNTLTRLWVPSKHSADLFRDSGVTVPIDIVHQGVDPSLYSYYERPKRKTFTFLQLGTLTIRKNPGALISAFLNLFKDNPDVRLVLKTQSGTLAHVRMPYKNIQIIDQLTPVEETIQLYRDADAFVFPSKGEGFGLPPVEAMATGLPTIVSANTGMLEYCNEEYNYPVSCPKKSKVLRSPKEWGDVGNWWEVDLHELMDRMKYVYEHQDEAREKGKKAAQWVKKNLTYDNTAQRMIEILREYEEFDPVYANAKKKKKREFDRHMRGEYNYLTSVKAR